MIIAGLSEQVVLAFTTTQRVVIVAAAADVIAALERDGRIVLRYADASGEVTAAANPNGSAHAIAGIVNERGNVMGLMPHPERAADAEVGGTDGLAIFRSLDRWLVAQPAAAERRS